MTRTNPCRRLNVVSLLCVTLLCLSNASMSAAIASSHAHHKQLVEIKGFDLESLRGESFDRLTAFAVQNHTLVPIPHQFEDFDDEGKPYFEASGGLRGTLNALDEHDSLFFLYTDAGDKISEDVLNSSDIVSEIALGSADTRRYIYIARGQHGFSHEPYTEFNEETGFLSSRHYSLEMDPDNLFVWGDFKYYSYQDTSKQSLFDSFKVRLNSGVFTNATRLTLSNKNISTKVLAVREGPVRTSILLTAKVKLAGITVTRFKTVLNAEPHSFDVQTKIHVPTIISKVMRSPYATLSLDGNDLDGSQFRTALSDKTAIVDGKLSEAEQAMIEHGIDNQNNWLWLSTGKGFDILSSLYVPDNFNAPITLHYQDDAEKKDKPERMPGQSPNIGFHIAQIPTDDTFHFELMLAFTNDIGNMSPGAYLRALQNPPYIAVSATPGQLRYAKH